MCWAFGGMGIPCGLSNCVVDRFQFSFSNFSQLHFDFWGYSCCGDCVGTATDNHNIFSERAMLSALDKCPNQVRCLCGLQKSKGRARANAKRTKTEEEALMCYVNPKTSMLPHTTHRQSTSKPSPHDRTQIPPKSMWRPSLTHGESNR